MKKTLTTPRRPSGFNEYLPSEQIEFNRLLDIIRGTYEKYGYSPIDTPDLELSEVLLAKGGGETEQQIYRFERGKSRVIPDANIYLSVMSHAILSLTYQTPAEGVSPVKLAFLFPLSERTPLK